MMETRKETMVVAMGATRMSEVPELGINIFTERQKVSSAVGRQRIKQRESVFVFRKLLSGWNSLAHPVSRAQAAPAC